MDLGKRIITSIILFGVINLVLWSGQELYHRKDTEQIKEIENWLDSESVKIKNRESQLGSLESQISSLEDFLDSYKHRIDLGEKHLADTYNIKVYEFNNLLNQYNSQFSEYEENMDSYNLKVDEVNDLIKNSGTRWYIIPIPIPTGGSLRGKM
jgi:peptidoglycan hydrolase CwlO-like protein